MPRFLKSLFVAATLFASVASAQSTYVTPFGMPVSFESYLPSALVPAGGPAPTGPIPLPMFGLIAAPLPAGFNGGEAVNGITGQLYNTDGAFLTIDNNPQYVGAIAPMPPFPVFGMVTAGMPITGLGWATVPAAVVGNQLLMSSPVAFQFRAPAAPFGPLGPVIPVPFALGPITGCDYDPSTGTVWLCDALGNIYNTTPAGLPVGPQPVAVVAMPGPAAGPVLTGLAVNRTNGPGAFPPPFGSTQLPGYHICVTNGMLIADALGPNPFIPTGSVGMSYGLAFSNDAQFFVGSAAPSNVAQIRLNRPAHNGFGGPGLTINLIGAFPLQTAILCYDLLPAAPTPVPWGGNIFLNPATLGTVILGTDPAGNAVVPVPGGAPPGVQFECFWIYGHPGNPPFFLSHTDQMEITLGLL